MEAWGSDRRPSLARCGLSIGAPLDAGRYYLVVADNFGHGKSTRPSDGLRAGLPHYGYGDLLDLQHKVITETSGIKKLHAILGVLMGGMNAWQWAEDYPDQVEAIMPVVSFARTGFRPQSALAMNGLADIRGDLDWQRGDYTRPPPGFIQASLLLRMMIYGVPHLRAAIPDTKAAEQFMAGVVKQNAEADPNDLL
jgi:homoserine O-acetyltransferase/O-succinyltransferase